ncbi:hypothetical protein [Roseateles violae]|uniref:Lipoprotein n=1 Tax=Roseateles violae TaxID=3058042 RepID=A0ABT8DQG0_9BURK|nr:hypothetical protein [Pelomonas sp. PFR6]MDN3920407.1 hypothetical protein [Pelomonas sp. PFR6]
MRTIQNFIGLSLLALIGCSNSQSVEVRILPKSYQVGSIKSELATPVVEEVIRVRASNVLVLTCTNTPQAKVQQFRTELLAKAQPKIELSFLKDGCNE